MNVMTPEHPRWEEFVDRLQGPEGCDFDSSGMWKCKGGYDKTYAVAILKSMGNIDIESTIQFFDRHGGHCDCEILFNVDPGGDER